MWRTGQDLSCVLLGRRESHCCCSAMGTDADEEEAGESAAAAFARLNLRADTSVFLTDAHFTVINRRIILIAIVK